jgi:hypothetical protein
MDLSVSAPQIKFQQGLVGGPKVIPHRITRKWTKKGTELILHYPQQTIINTPVRLKTVFLVPPDKGIVRKYAILEAKTDNKRQALTLHKVILLDEPLPEKPVFTMPGWQSYPVFTEQYFFSVEFPAANAAVVDNRIVLSHMPGKIMDLPIKFRTRDAVIGVCAKGHVRETFKQYADSFRRQRDRLHFNYNCWWTVHGHYKENAILKVIKALHERLYKPFNISLDSFTIDLGWSAKQGIWKISKKRLPNQFSRLTETLTAQKSSLGLWVSPSNHYSPSSFDSKWAEKNGYESYVPESANVLGDRLMCLAKGTRYQTETKKVLSAYVKKFKLGQMKFDGYYPQCAETDHGHLPGELSREVTAEGIIDIFNKIRQTNPNIWMEPTCFGYNASPWWLRYVDSVIGPYGDDAPFGSVPAPIYRESYTTSRDFFNLRGSVTPVPIAAQEVLGIVHQTAEPLYNDAVVTLMRGHQFISLYINPNFLKQNDYDFLARLIVWARANADILSRTKILQPQQWRETGIPSGYDMKSIPRQTYGYLHWLDGQGLLCLRNPWMQMDQIELVLDQATVGIDRPIADYSAIQVYPFQRCLSKGLKYGDKLSLKMGPYETKVIKLNPHPPAVQPGPDPSDEQFHPAKISQVHSDFVETASQPVSHESITDNRTVISLPQGIRWKSTIEAQTPDQGWQLYYLLEADQLVKTLDVKATVNNQPTTPKIIDSEAGWSATLLKKPRFWRWFVLDLPQGKWKANLTLDTEKGPARGAAWLMRSFVPPGLLLQDSSEPAIPTPPGYKARVSREVIKMTDLQTPNMKKVTLPPKIETNPGS